MNDDSPSDKAIIPGEKRGELSLPSEMIHRGLELAVQIERKHGIQPAQPSPTTPVAKGHLVRGYISFMEWCRNPDGAYKLKDPESTDHEKLATRPPVVLWLSFDLDGIHISCIAKDELPTLEHLEGNEDHYRLLNASADIHPFTVPVSSLALYYVLVQPWRPERYPPGLLPSIPREQWKNFEFVHSPANQPGFQGPATKEANRYFDINRDCLRIVLIYISLIDDLDRKRELVSKNPPVKLSFTVIDPNGENNPTATRELYHAMLDAKNLKRSNK